MRHKVAAAINELVLLFIPIIILTTVISMSGIGTSVQVNTALSLVLPSCFVVLSLYLPMNYNHVVEFRNDVSDSRRDSERQAIDPEEEEMYLKPHRTGAKFIIRSCFLALTLFTYPIVSNIENSNIEQLRMFANNNSTWIRSLYTSISILISIYITYLILSLSFDYLKYSIPSEPSVISSDFSTKSALVIVSILELISVTGLLSTRGGVESGIWFASSIIGSIFIVLLTLFLD